MEYITARYQTLKGSTWKWIQNSLQVFWLYFSLIRINSYVLSTKWYICYCLNTFSYQQLLILMLATASAYAPSAAAANLFFLPKHQKQRVARPRLEFRDQDFYNFSLNIKTETETENVKVSMLRQRLQISKFLIPRLYNLEVVETETGRAWAKYLHLFRFVNKKNW